ncbi:hypothetical protein SERLADRAFT_406586 [Serpula lacrymans var. lacrymans S7.9]|uniref:Uncharacterized protein n=1 Tax=Serpula lacrymans var. lacrymans (strain S7.9) TaxID=578457 RepID=F8NN19_SERL9|nr:uncharacterized protein SERLADRAFT_406586 [Serpula lacrymans var. lacrymans S7.9]EGO27513.1 hypothetical protein SERLADRAFT_406586 [Serpula lacrymans var. lacrymans S7.9]
MQNSLGLQFGARELNSPNDLVSQMMELQQANSKLHLQNEILRAKNDTLQGAYDALVQKVPQLLTDFRQPISIKKGPDGAIEVPTLPIVVLDVALKREDYPNVRFWRKQEYQQHCKEYQEAQLNPEQISGIGEKALNRLFYVEYEDRTTIDTEEGGRNIRKLARSIWFELADLGMAPKTWMSTSRAVLDYYRSKMYKKFPQLCFCESDWKADQLAIDNYPSWYANHFTRAEKKAVKNEAIDDSKKNLHANKDSSKRLPESMLVSPSHPVKKQRSSKQSIPSGNTPTLDVSKSECTEKWTPVQTQPEASISPPPPPQVLPLTPTINGVLEPSKTCVVLDRTDQQSVDVMREDQDAGKAKVPKKNKLCPRNTNTARNLCALDWLKMNKNGTAEEYKTYYNNLDQETKKMYQERAEAAQTQKQAAGTSA